jgi:uncharacterized protein YhbP (UPF0306 family)
MDEKAERILKEQWFCVLSTASPDGMPWATPVFYNYELSPSMRMVWESSRHAQHSQLIAANPNIALVVANFARREADEAVYFRCTAREVPPDELNEALHLYINGGHPRTPSVPRTPDLYLEDQPLRLYEARPTEAYVLTITFDEDGRRIDRRIEIDLP